MYTSTCFFIIRRSHMKSEPSHLALSAATSSIFSKQSSCLTLGPKSCPEATEPCEISRLLAQREPCVETHAYPSHVRCASYG